MGHVAATYVLPTQVVRLTSDKNVDIALTNVNKMARNVNIKRKELAARVCYKNYTVHMIKTQAARQQAAASALGSVRAEGLRPSVKTQKLVRDYADGKITAHELRTRTLKAVRGKSVK